MVCEDTHKHAHTHITHTHTQNSPATSSRRKQGIRQSGWRRQAPLSSPWACSPHSSVVPHSLRIEHTPDCGVFRKRDDTDSLHMQWLEMYDSSYQFFIVTLTATMSDIKAQDRANQEFREDHLPTKYNLRTCLLPFLVCLCVGWLVGRLVSVFYDSGTIIKPTFERSAS